MIAIHLPRIKLFALALAAVVAVVDQMSKYAILDILPVEGMAQPVMSFFNLVLVHNHGISFGLFNRAPVEAQQAVFLGIAMVISCVLLVWLVRTHSTLISVAIGLVIGGAIGNSMDRVAHGAVIDFLDFYATFNGVTKHWPAFNVADSAVVGGVALLLVHSLAFDKKTLQR